MNKRRTVLPLFFASLVGVVGGGANDGALAQGNPGANRSGQPAEGAARLMEEITVTARRRAESELETPVSISAFTGEALESRGIDNFVTMDAYIPNLSIGGAAARGTSMASMSIRGIGNWQPSIYSDPTVGIYVDDVYYAKISGALLDLVDVERLEVLRGPQGTLFGKNTMGGAIRYFTVQPSSEFGGYAKMTVGNYSRQDIDAAVNLPLADDFAVRLAGTLRQRDGFVTRIVDGVETGNIDNQAIRLQARWTPGAWDVKASFDDTVTKNNGPARDIPYTCPWVPGAGPGTNCLFPFLYFLNTGQVFDDRWVTADPYTVYGGERDREDTRRQGASLNFGRSFGDVAFRSVTGWQDGDQYDLTDWDGTPLGVFEQRNQINYDYWTQEFQFSGNTAGGRLNWAAGVFYFTEDSTSYTVPGGLTFGLPTAVPAEEHRESTSTAVYAQGTFSATERLDVTLGVRYTEDKEDRSSLNGTVTDVQKGTWDTVDPKLSFEFDFSEKVMGYVSASRGYRPGTFTEYPDENGVSQLRLVDPETLWNYEVGLKGRFLDDRLQITADVFKGDYDDIQVATVHPDPLTGTVYGLIENAAKAHVNGAEFEFRALLGESLIVRGSYGYLDTGYDELGPAVALGVVNSKFIRAPENSYSIGLQYVTSKVAGGELSANIDYGWKGDQETTNTGTNNVTIEAYGLLNGRLQYKPAGESWTVALIGTNLLDEEYLIGGFDSAIKEGIVGIVHQDRGRPREYGVQLAVDF